MSADTMRDNPCEPLARRFDVDAVLRGKLVRGNAHERGRLAGNRVGDRAGIELHDAATGDIARDDLAREVAVEDALLPADEREVGVGREGERGLVVMGEVPLEVAHLALLLVAHETAQGVRQRTARLIHLALEEVRHIERKHERTLVVQHATANEIALATRHVEGVDRPAKPLGNDVRVGNGRDLAVGCARKIRVAYVAFALVGIEPQPPCDAKRDHERIMASLAPRHTRTRRLGVAHGANLHQRADVLDRVLPYLVDVGVNLLLELLIGHASSISPLFETNGTRQVGLMASPLAHTRQRIKKRDRRSGPHSALLGW